MVAKCDYFLISPFPVVYVDVYGFPLLLLFFWGRKKKKIRDRQKRTYLAQIPKCYHILINVFHINLYS